MTTANWCFRIFHFLRKSFPISDTEKRVVILRARPMYCWQYSPERLRKSSVCGY